jgi:glycosyltransferase involved in cell wall biosynthesis
MFKTEISIIIPVYRVKEYLEECLKSVLAQDFELPFNILLIETGSDDGSDEICQRYESMYPGKVYWFHYEINQGISYARNLGILHANGKYISFVDGDDLLEPDYLTGLYSSLKKDNELQIIFGGYHFLSDGTKKKAKYPSFEGRGRDALIRFLGHAEYYRGYCWGGLFSRNFLLQNHLMFDCDMRLYEDMLFLYKTLFCAYKVNFNKDGGYLYRQHSSSTMKTNKDWLGYHLKCLERFKMYSHQDEKLQSLLSKPSKAIRKQLKLDCRVSNDIYSKTEKQLYSETLKKFKRNA